jgi:type IV secretory pathway VirB3-like protein
MPGVGLPLGAFIALGGCAIFTMVLVRNWRYWIVLFILWGLRWLFLREKLRRDHNGLRVWFQGIRTKAVSLDTDVWHGVTVKSLTVRQDKRTFRGIRA